MSDEQTRADLELLEIGAAPLRKGQVHPLVTKLHVLRLAKGWSMARLCKESGIAYTTLTHWNRGSTFPKVYHFNRCLKALGYELGIVEISK